MPDESTERHIALPDAELEEAILHAERLDFEGHEVFVWRPERDKLFEAVPADIDISGVESTMLAREVGPCGGVEAAVAGAKVAAREVRVVLNARLTNGADSSAELAAAGVEMGLLADEVEPEDGTWYGASAHGNPVELMKARERGHDVIDFTCIYVDKTHREIETVAVDAEADGVPTGIIYLSIGGKPGHAELVGSQQLMEHHGVPYVVVFDESEIDSLFADGGDESLTALGWERIRIVSQTTNDSDAAEGVADLITDRIVEHDLLIDTQTYPYNRDDVCRTVTHRQNATREMVRRGVENLIVMGSVNSKNTQSLVKVALAEVEAMFAEGEQPALTNVIYANSHLQLPAEIDGHVGIVSGASSDQRNIDWMVSTIAPIGAVEMVGGTDKGDGPFRLVRRGKIGRERARQIEISNQIRGGSDAA